MGGKHERKITLHAHYWAAHSVQGITKYDPCMDHAYLLSFALMLKLIYLLMLLYQVHLGDY